MGTVAKKIMMGSGAVALPSDDQFNRTSFLSHFDGSNDGVNNAFDDGSASNHTVTAAGNVTQGSFGPFARPDGNWGWNFDGDGDYLTVADSTEFDFGTGNFTIEGWINPAVISSFQAIFSIGSAVQIYSYNNSIIAYFNDEDNTSSYTINGLTGPSSSVSANTWTHFAVVRNGNTYTAYVNGVAGSSLTSSDTVASSSNAPAIGTYLPAPTTYEFNGHISNLRLVKGTAVYTSNFTPSTSKLTAITNTKLLTCQSNRFIDNSASGHAITPTGTPAVSAFGPFLTSSVYDPAVNGASAYLDGNGDYLSIANSSDFNLAANDFCFEFWFWCDSLAQYDTILSLYNTWAIEQESSGGGIKIAMWISSGSSGSWDLLSAGIMSNLLKVNEWNHLVIARTGNTLKSYHNGAIVYNSSFSGTIGSSSNILYSGTYDTSAYWWDGYISDVKLSNGSTGGINVSGNTITVPTAPLAVTDSNTKLLLNMADGQAIDSAAQNNLTLYGNAKISTGQAKFGNTSMVFDGTGDYVTLPSSSFKPFGTGDFTIECFARFDAINGKGLFQLGASYLPSAVTGPAVFASVATNNPWRIYYGTSEADASVSPSADTWYHVAYVRSSGVTKLYVDGTSVISQNDTTNYTNTFFVIGGGYSLSFLMDGYIDEFRISHMARYTSNFTAPTKAFTDKGQDA
tara:strand:- start:123 stop:2165 length:2043 start_codon:yes stop_codon:yes gene_type:complete